MNNRLREISAPILELTNLRLLQLDYNLIESIPPGVCFFTSSPSFFFLLSHFCLLFTQQINELKYLESLLLRHNRLKSIPTHTLRSLPFLQTLWLDHNPLPSGSDVNVGQLQLTKGRSLAPYLPLFHLPSCSQKLFSFSFFHFSFSLLLDLVLSHQVLDLLS